MTDDLRPVDATDEEGGADGADGADERPPRTDAVERRRTIWLAVTVVLGTIVLLWTADRLARWGAESVLARALQEQTGVQERPTVEVHGGPVLIQALRGRYDHVEVAIESVSSGPLRLDDYAADLRGVYLSFPDLLDGNTGQLFVEQAVEDAFLAHEDLERYLRFTGRALDVEAAGDSQLRVSGPVDVLGTVLPVSALVSIDAEGDALVLRPTRLDVDRPLEGLAELLVTQRFSLQVPLDPLPFGQRLTDIEVRPSGIAVGTAGSGVVLG